MTKVLQPRGIHGQLKNKLNYFLYKQDFVELYKEYNWKDDNHRAGFPKIRNLEKQLTNQVKVGGVAEIDINTVVQWGNPRPFVKPTIIVINSDILPLLNYTLPDWNESYSEAKLVYKLESSVYNLGPTYASKVLRFARPEHFGAIDRWCVNMFGKNGLQWIDLSVKGKAIAGDGWPCGYGVWINILRYFAHKLPSNCPHPPDFISDGLRDEGDWTCADVEMALFSYASGRSRER